ncbi:DUF1254 domain-containing protein [Pseudochelatococcus sp. B33]
MKQTRALKIDSALGLRRDTAPRRRPWQMLARFSGAVLYALVFGLTLGALVHIVTVFAIPYIGSSDAVSRLSREAAAARLPEPVEPGNGVFNPPWPDPAFVTMVCRFDLGKGPQRIRARAPDGFAGLSLHAPGGGVLYAVTDEVAQEGELSLLVMTPDQAMDIAGGEGADVRFVLPARHGMAVTQGLAVYRVMAPLPSLRESARAVASSLRCESY